MAVVMHSVVGPSKDSPATKIGALLLETRHTSLRHLLVMDTVDGFVENQSRIEFEKGHPFSWTHVNLIDQGHFSDVGRELGTANSVPLPAGWLVAKHLAERKDKTEVSCLILSNKDLPMRPGLFKKGGDAVTLYVDDIAEVVYRLKGDEVHAIEWGGMIATVVPEEADLRVGLSPEVRRSAGEFLASADRR